MKNIIIVDLVIEDYLNDNDINNRIYEIFTTLSLSYPPNTNVTLGVNIINNFLNESYLIINEFDEHGKYKKINISKGNVVCSQKYRDFINNLK